MIQILTVVTNRPGMFLDPAAYYLWLGGTKLNGTWKWNSDGQTINTSLLIVSGQYSNWFQGYPCTSCDQPYLIMCNFIGNPCDKKWYDDDGTGTSTVICEKDVQTITKLRTWISTLLPVAAVISASRTIFQLLYLLQMYISHITLYCFGIFVIFLAQICVLIPPPFILKCYSTNKM